MGDEVLSIQKWATNGALLADIAKLGYLTKDMDTLDCTYGKGTMWREWAPDRLTACDLDPAKSPVGFPVDFTAMPWATGKFDAVVLDGPYRLVGGVKSVAGFDERYGTTETASWQQRFDLIERGITECARVLNATGTLLVKAQDQVNGGKMRWQTIAFTRHAASLGLGLVDRFDFLSYRPQPAGRRQLTARHNASQMLVFRKGWEWE